MRKSQRRPSNRVWIVTAIAAIGAVVGAVLIPLSAEATTVALSGTAATMSNVKLSGVAVTAYDFPGGVLGSIAGSTTTSSTGAFSFATLAAGDYTLHFGNSKLTYAQFLGETTDPTEAEDIPLVTTGGGHSYVSAVLAASGSIGGSVKTTTNAALSGYTVRAYPDGGDESSPVLSTTTSSSGAYSLAGLQPGSYRLEALSTAASPSYAPAFSGGAMTIDDATGLGVAAGVTTPYSFSLGKSGSVSGKVIGQTLSGFEPLPGVTVTPYLMIGPSPSFTGSTSEGAKQTVTSATGAYTLAGLAPGYYALDFDAGHTAIGASHSIYGRAFLGNADAATNATIVHVTSSGSIAGQNITLEPAGSVTFNFEDGPAWINTSTQINLPNIRVTIDHQGADPEHPSKDAQTAFTNASGDVTFTGLGGGTWMVVEGSNEDSDPSDGITEDTSYERNWQDFAVSSGFPDVEDYLMYPKPAGGLQATVAPTISNTGSPVVGSNIFVQDSGTWNGTVDSYSYQWLRNGVPIAGETGSNYELQGGDLGATITARVTAESFRDGTGTADSASAGTILVGNLSFYGYLPGVYGSFQVGDVVSLQGDNWELGGLVYTYQWQNSTNGTTWNNILGAVSSTYQVTNADQLAGHLRVHYTISREGYSTITADSASNTVFTNAFTATTAPKVVATATTFSVVDGVWSPNIGTTTVTWTDHKPGGSAPTTPGSTLARAGTTGDYVSVVVDRSAPGVSDDQYQFTAQTGTVAVTSAATVTGTAQVGSTLTGNPPVFAPTGLSLDAQWQHRIGTTWKNITGAVASTYQLQSTDVGDQVRIAYTGSKAGYSDVTAYSNSTAVVIKGASPAPVIGPSVSGTPGTNATVIASAGFWLPAPASFTYQWEYSANGLAPYTKISGATKSNYTIPASLLGKQLFVAVTPVLSGHNITSAIASAGTVTALNLKATANLKVTHSGNTYTASGATFSPTPTSVTYEWYAYDANDLGFNPIKSGSTYTVVSPNDTRHLFVVATGSLAPYGDTSQPPVFVQKGTIQKTSGVQTITGTKVGTTLTPTTTTYSPSTGVTITRVWQYLSGSTWKTIPGATGLTYSPAAAYVGKQVRVAETAAHVDYTNLTTDSTPTTVVIGDAATPGVGGSAPAIGGDNVIGGVLQANPGGWTGPAGLKFTYQWLKSTDNSTWSDIAGAVAQTYTIPESAYGVDYIGVRITAVEAGYTPNPVVVPAVGLPNTGEFTVVTTPKVTKSAAGVYSVSAGAWKPAATSVTYEWVSYDPSTDSSTGEGSGSTFLPSHSLDGLQITVVVMPKREPAYDDGEYPVVARLGSAITPDSPITVTGTLTSSYTLTANLPSWSVPSPAVAVQWYRGTKAISLANDPNYTLTDADVGSSISVRVTVSKPGFPTSVYTADGGTPIYGTGLAPATPSIVGTGGADDPLSVSPLALPVPGTTVTYQWFDDFNDIPGAVGTTYTPTAAEIGDEITVELHYSKAHYANDQAVLPGIVVQPGSPLAYISLFPLGVSGTGQLGSTLTAVVGAWNYTPNLHYQWQYFAPAAVTWADIPGATSTSYVPTGTEVGGDGLVPGGFVRVQVTATLPGHADAVVAATGVTVQP